MTERERDLTEPVEDDLPDKPEPEPVDDELSDEVLEGEDVPDDDFLTPEQAREDPTIDDRESVEIENGAGDAHPEADPTATEPDEASN